MNRRAEFRPFGWINDLNNRDQIELDPPYQRRSVWSDRYKSEFVTTVLLNYPCPAIFLFEEIRPNGTFVYKVVDGKQRLTTLFDFISDRIAVDENHPRSDIRGKYFSTLSDADKLLVWRYSFAVEFIEQENETIINDIFNRINKNVARLSPQELRHARFYGRFMEASEKMTALFEGKLPVGFPRIAPQSKRQMKDVENTSVLLLFCEQGERSLGQIDIDAAYSKREDDWEREEKTISEFKSATDILSKILASTEGQLLSGSRLRNQADFYSLFAAIVEGQRKGWKPNIVDAAMALSHWVNKLKEIEDDGAIFEDDVVYLTAARSASNDPTPRRLRIDRVKAVLGM